MDFHPEDVIISLINIVVLFVLLRLILWKHVNRFLTDRSNRVQNEMDSAKKQQQEAEALRLEYDKKVDDINERGRDLMRESQLKANEESERILKETRDKAKEMINDAQIRINEEKNQALEKANLEVTRLATDIAARILEREVSQEDNENAVDEFFHKGEGFGINEK